MKMGLDLKMMGADTPSTSVVVSAADILSAVSVCDCSDSLSRLSRGKRKTLHPVKGSPANHACSFPVHIF